MSFVPARLALVALALSVFPRAAAAQQASPDSAAPRKVAHAVRLQGGRIEVDGRLDDAAWSQAVFFSDFTAKEPVEGAAPSESTRVGILYDDDALYIAARMYSSDPAAIQRNVSRRDQGASNSEHIWFSFDSYLDRRTAYSFGVTASGVRIDWYHPTDNEYNLDMTFDPVYEARARVDSSGWTAELRIPFSQLRFRRQDVQVWGFNVDRWIPSKFEDIFWRPVPKNVTGWSSYMGELHGIAGIRPTARVEVLPYVAGDATMRSRADAANPFDPDGRHVTARAGADLKVGLGPNLTAEATVNPDFGQVEADPAVVNLSVFESIFEEKRPFFIEGSQLLRGSGANYYYSRRIGAAPRGGASGDYVDRPGASTILGAGKITGRLARGLSIGALGAITAREYAETYSVSADSFGRTEIAPVTGFGVMRLSQQFGRNNSTAGVILTGVQRDLPEGAPLASILNRQAWSGGVDWNLRFSRGFYEFAGFAGFSRIEGDSTAIAAQQLSSRRYYQRPDQDYVRFDPSRTSLSGYTAGLQFSKLSGRHWLYTIFAGAESPGFETNDMGRIATADGLSSQAILTYREVRPSRRFRSWSVQLNTVSEWNYGWDRQFTQHALNANATFRNQVVLNFSGNYIPRGQDERLTRGGPSMGTPSYWYTVTQLSSSFAARTQWRARLYYERGEFDDHVYRLSGLLGFRPVPRWFVQFSPNYVRYRQPRQYVTSIADTAAGATFGRRYVFSAIDQSQWSMQMRLNYAFTPDFTLEAYVEPFIANGRFARHGELPRPRATDLRIYGEAPGTTAATNPDGTVTVTADGSTFTLPNLDFSGTSFRSNLVLRWEWRPGSTLFVVWQQNRAGAGTGPGPARVRDLFGGLDALGTNFLAVKMTYWLAAH